MGVLRGRARGRSDEAVQRPLAPSGDPRLRRKTEEARGPSLAYSPGAPDPIPPRDFSFQISRAARRELCAPSPPRAPLGLNGSLAPSPGDALPRAVQRGPVPAQSSGRGRRGGGPAIFPLRPGVAGGGRGQGASACLCRGPGWWAGSLGVTDIWRGWQPGVGGPAQGPGRGGGGAGGRSAASHWLARVWERMPSGVHTPCGRAALNSRAAGNSSRGPAAWDLIEKNRGRHAPASPRRRSPPGSGGAGAHHACRHPREAESLAAGRSAGQRQQNPE